MQLRNQKSFEGKIKFFREVCELWDIDAKNEIIYSDKTRMEQHSNKREFIRSPGKQNDGNLNLAIYIQFLKDNLPPDLDEGEIFSVIELHAKDHVQHYSLADEGITVLKDWPAQSPESNIIKQM